MNRILWLTGYRDGSNVLGTYLLKRGAYQSPLEPLLSSHWNRDWIEDKYLHDLLSKLLGTDEWFGFPKQVRLEYFHKPYLYELEGYIHAGLRLSKESPLLVKISEIGILWPEVIEMFPYVNHILINCTRNQTDRINSLLRVTENLRPKRTVEHVIDFFSGFDSQRFNLAKQFLLDHRTVVTCDYESVRIDPAKEWGRVATEVGLTPNDSIANLLFDQKYRLPTK